MAKIREETPKRIVRGGAYEPPTILCPRCRRAMAVRRKKDTKAGILGGEVFVLKYHCKDCGTEWEEEEKIGGRCFIATAAYGTPFAIEINSLRAFRDKVLLSHKIGILFVKTYYKLSPPIATFISKKKFCKDVVRKMLTPLVKYLQKKGY